MKTILYIKEFIKDLINAKKNKYYSGSEKTYQILRFLYLISHGYFLKIIEFFLLGAISKNKSFITFEKIPSNEINFLKEEIMKNKIFISQNDQGHNLKYLTDGSIDFKYYSKINATRLMFSSKDLIASKKVFEFVEKYNFNELLNNYFNCKLYLQKIDSWITLPVPKDIDDYELMTKYDDTQQWHRDVDKLKDVKVFIYLSDVNTDDDGPFQLVINSNKTIWFNPYNYSNRIKFRVKNYLIQKNHNKDIHTFYGSKGTVFAADTRAFHRGKAIREKNNFRFIFQLYYSIHSIGKKSQVMLDPNFESYPNWQKELKKEDNFAKGLFKNN